MFDLKLGNLLLKCVYILPFIPKGLQMELPVLPTAHSDFDVAVEGLKRL